MMQVAASKIRAPTIRKMPSEVRYEDWSPSKKKRIKENFLSFCDIVLAYTQYKSSAYKHEEIRQKNNTSPLDSGVSTAESYASDAAFSYSNTDEESLPLSSIQRHHSQGNPNRHGSQGENDVPADDDSWDAVTCFCRKPFAGRPMIECSVCLTWLHLTCAKVRRTNIPEVFVCELCRSGQTRKSLARKKPRRSNGGDGRGSPSTSTNKNRFKSDSSSYTHRLQMSPVSSESSHQSPDTSPSSSSEQYCSSVSPHSSSSSSGGS